jgi:RNA polymerase sigma factor (sigma-70 family)
MQLSQAAIVETISKPMDQDFAALRPKLIRIALALGIDPEDAKDLAQESLLAAHRNLQRFDPEKGSFEGWASVILLRRARNRQRSSQRRWKLQEAVRRFAPRSVAPAAGAVEARLTLQRLLRELTPRQREVVALYEIGGLSAAEAGEHLDMTAAGVRSIARDARQRLTECVRRVGDE